MIMNKQYLIIQEYSKETLKTDAVINYFGISISSYVPLILYEITYKFQIATNPKYLHIIIPLPPPFKLYMLFVSFNQKQYALQNAGQLKANENTMPGIDIIVQNVPSEKDCTIRLQATSLLCCSNFEEWAIEIPNCLFPSKFSPTTKAVSKYISNESNVYGLTKLLALL